MLFASPVAITANTTYVASYHTNVGGYAIDGGYFATAGVDSPPLHALPARSSGGNGVFAYGATQFPTQTFNATNYWVDVVFAPSLDDSTPPVISSIKATIDRQLARDGHLDDQRRRDVEDRVPTDPASADQHLALPPGTITVNQSAFVHAAQRRR